MWQDHNIMYYKIIYIIFSRFVSYEVRFILDKNLAFRMTIFSLKLLMYDLSDGHSETCIFIRLTYTSIVVNIKTPDESNAT